MSDTQQLEKGQLFEDSEGTEVRITGVSKETQKWITYTRTKDNRAFSITEETFARKFTAKA